MIKFTPKLHQAKAIDLVFNSRGTKYRTLKLKELNLYDDYKKWLSISVNSFDKIMNFMDYNSITINYSKYFMDYHHVYPEYTHLIVDKLQDINATSSNKDFGIILNKENINNYIKNLD